MIFPSFQHLSVNFVVPDPDESKEDSIGGHALVLFSYDDDKKLFGICNSWSENYADHGCMYMSYKYITDKICVLTSGVSLVCFNILEFAF